LLDHRQLIIFLGQTNCLTEIFFDEAIERARQLDRERQENPSEKALPPLFGLPVSLKDSFQVFQHDTSTGLACYVNKPAKENSALAAMLLDLGAVLFCKTNLPQSIMTADSENNVFGRTLNPHNTTLTAGGSTGGEGALIALRGSLLGVGTDIAGSIRVPSVCNGIYGFRASVGLVPHGGVRDLTVPGTDGVRSTAGPMATSIRDCSLFLKSIMQAETWKYDSTATSIPWRNIQAKPKLRIGLVENDGVYTPSPPVLRGLRQAVDLLRRSNRVEVIPLTLPSVKDHYQDLLSYLSLSGGEVIKRPPFSYLSMR
jgi:amidase